MNARMRMTKRPARGSNPFSVTLNSVALRREPALRSVTSAARFRSEDEEDRTVSEATNDDRIRVLIVDDESLARDRTRQLLEEEPDIEIVGECASGTEAVAAIESA